MVATELMVQLVFPGAGPGRMEEDDVDREHYYIVYQ